MDKVTQQNASLVEEASAAAASLEEQGARLTEAVGAFRLIGAGLDGLQPLNRSEIRAFNPRRRPSQVITGKRSE